MFYKEIIKEEIFLNNFMIKFFIISKNEYSKKF